MSESRTPPLDMTPVSRKSRRRPAKKKKQRSSSSGSSTSSRETSIDRKTKSRGRNSRKRRRSSSSSSSMSSSPVRSKRSKRRKTVRDHALQSSRDRRKGSQGESSVLKDLVAALENRNRVPGFGSQNVIPEFDPQAKTQTVKSWLSRINESALVYGWSEKQTVFYALPRLAGLAKRWFDGLTSVKYTWQEWQEKMLRAFPGDENYGNMLTEMLARKSRRNETLEEYYYDKIRLINRCEISGVKAVDCLTQGIYDSNIRMGAQGLCFQEPEELLTHLRKISSKREEYGKAGGSLRERIPFIQPNRLQTTEASQRRTSGSGTCFNCRQKGHFWQLCPKELIQCGKCKRVGHNATQCNSAYNRSENVQLGTVPKTVNKIESMSGSCNKYLKDVFVNEKKVRGFLDLGSECTLLSDTFLPNIEEEPQNPNDLPLLKGFANGSIKPKAKVKILLQIDGILEEVEAYSVPHEILPYGTDVLIGQDFTELPDVRIYKTDSELVLFRATDKLAKITIEDSVEIRGATVVPVITSECPDRSNMFISSDMCLKPGSEYMILPGVYSFEKNRANIIIMALNATTVKLKKGQLISRGVVLPEFILNKQNQSADYNRTDSENIFRITEQDAKDIRYDQINTDDDLPTNYKDELAILLNKHRKVFAFSNAELGKTNLTEMHIKLKDDTPVTYRPYRLSIAEREKVKEMLEDLCTNGIIRESESEYASPVIVVPKKNGELRLCVDYRALNKKTHKDKYPMPLIDDQIDSLCGQNFFTTLDLTSGYHQIPIAEGSKHLTAFITQDGHFEYNRVPFGLSNAPAVFQRLIHKVLNARKIPGVLAYMDDIVISSKTLDEGMFKLCQVLEALQEANLTLNLGKCHFFRTCIEYLGYEISSHGVKPGQRKTEAVALFKRPDNVHEIRQFIGLASFFRRFVPGFAVLARPLTRLTKSNEKWVWEEAQEEAFKAIKQILITRPVLAIYNPTLLTELHTDASQLGIGGILMQRSDEKSPLRAVAYFSRQTTPEEQHFHSFELETLAVVMSLVRFRSYLIGIEFKVVTDCNAVRLTWTKRDLVARIARWWLQAQEFTFTIEYRPGTQMSHVDALSRNPVGPMDLEESNKITACNILKISTTPCLDDIQYTDPQLVLIKCILNSACNEAKDIKNDYVLKDGKLYRKVGDSLRWVVPQDARWKVCHMSHDEFGHMGLEKTLDKMKQTYWFKNMTPFVKRYVRACIPCAYAKQPTGKKEGFLHPIPKTPIPFHSVHIDHLGPFIKSSSGNTYILGIIDGYSKFIILRPVRNTKTKTTVTVLRDVFGIFDAPKLLISDRGTSFTSNEFAEFARELEIKHIKNAVAMPRANGQIERYNRTILASLVALMHGENDKNWDTHLNTVQWSLNNTLNKGIGKTPAEAVFSKRTVHLSEGHLRDLTIDDFQPQESISDKLREEISATIEDNQAKMEKRFNEKRRTAREYKEGDLVLVQKQMNNPGESNKLLPRYSGPYRVTKVLGLDRYEVSSIEGHSKRKYQNVYAADKIKPWINFTLSDSVEEPGSIQEMDKDMVMDMDDKDSDDRDSDVE